MDTKDEKIVPIERADKENISWARLFCSADDAFLAQMQGKGQLVFVDADGGQTPIVSDLKDFIVVVLSEPIRDGYAQWGLTLPTIVKTKEPK